MQGGETNIDVEIDQNNIQVGALEVLKVLRPSWKAEDVKFLVSKVEGVWISLECPTDPGVFTCAERASQYS